MKPISKDFTLDKELQRLGTGLVTRFFVLVKTAGNYREGHGAIAVPAVQLLSLLEEAHRLNIDATLSLGGGYLYLGETRLKVDKSGLEAFRFVMGLLKSYFLKSIGFEKGVREVDLKRLAYIFTEIEPIPSMQTYSRFADRLQERMIQKVVVDRTIEDQEFSTDDTARMDIKARVTKTYFQAVEEAAQVMKDATAGRPFKLARTRRLVQHMIDYLRDAEAEMLGLCILKGSIYHHAVNVTILSLAIGQRVGLTKTRCCDLGIAAFLHDIGKAAIPEELHNRTGAYSPEELQHLEQHPILGVKTLLELKTLDTLTARVVTGTFEHHLHYDLSGYPRISARKPCLFGRIIAIAEDYDSFTSGRLFNSTPNPPEKVLQFMRSKAGTIYDPILMKLFVNCIGVLPIGTMLLLQSGELAVVVRNTANPENWQKPVVTIITSPAGKEVQGETINLADALPGRSVLGSVDPNPFRIDLARFIRGKRSKGGDAR